MDGRRRRLRRRRRVIQVPGSQRQLSERLQRGVIDEGVAQFSRHETGVACASEQMFESDEQLLAGSDLCGESSVDTRAERDQLFAAQLLERAHVACEHGTSQRLGVEAGACEQA